VDNPEQEKPDLGSEFRELGENLKNLFRTTWESEEAQRFRDEFKEGLGELGKTMDETADEFRHGETGQRLRGEAEEFKQRVRSGEFESQARSEIRKALRMINTELENMMQNWPEKKDPGEEV
jgi:ElaB/YqjD/DUF883 family membrane-anchored ribosome-binding protein